MKINRNARVSGTDGNLGRVRHVIVDPQTREVTDIVVGDDVREWTVPMSAVRSVDGDTVLLHGATHEIINQVPQFDRDSYHSVDHEALREESQQTALHGGAPLLDANERSVEIDGGDDRPVAPRPDAATASGPYELQLRAERLRVNTEEQAGRVRLRREIVERVETVQVPVREERLVIEVLPGTGRVLIGDCELAPGECIELSLMKERVLIAKEAVVTDNVRIHKETVTHTERVSETLREEQLTVNDPHGAVAGGSVSQPVAGNRGDLSSGAHAAGFIARPGTQPETAGSYHPDSPRPAAASFSSTPAGYSNAPGDRTVTGAANDMYDPTPEPMAYAAVQPNGERRPVMEALMDDKSLTHPIMTDPSPNPEMEEVAANRDRALADGEARRAQPHPAASGEFNPGAAEYDEQQPAGTSGSGTALNPNVPERHDRLKDV